MWRADGLWPVRFILQMCAGRNLGAKRTQRRKGCAKAAMLVLTAVSESIKAKRDQGIEPGILRKISRRRIG